MSAYLTFLFLHSTGITSYNQGLTDGIPYTTLNYAVGPGGFELANSFKKTGARRDPSQELDKGG